MDENPYKSPEFVGDEPVAVDKRPLWIRLLVHPESTRRQCRWLGWLFALMGIGMLLTERPLGSVAMSAVVVCIALGMLLWLAGRWMDRQKAWARDGAEESQPPRSR